VSAVPTPYTRQASFSGFSPENSNQPTVGPDLEAEFNAVRTSLTQTQSRLAEIQRDDGQLRDGVVTPESLSAGVRALFGYEDNLAGDLGSPATGKGIALIEGDTYGVNFTGGEPDEKGFWTDIGAGANVTRLRDRVLVAAAADNTAKWDSSSPSFAANRSWLGLLGIGLDYIERDATMAVTSATGKIAFSAATRTSDSPTAPSQTYGFNSIGIASISISDEDTMLDSLGNVLPGYAFYGEAIRNAGGGTAIGFELDVANMQADALEISPLGAVPSKATIGLWLPSGAAKAGAQDATLAIGIVGNGARWKKGVVFLSNALTEDGSGYSTAVEMKIKQRLVWRYSGGAGAVAGSITATATAAANQTELDFTDTGLQIKGSAGQILVRVPVVASAINYLALSAAASGGPILRPDGTDANCPLLLRSKGTSSVAMQGSDATNKVAANNTGIGFYGTTPIAKPTASGSRGGNAALASLLTQLANLGLITDGTSA
jgi:hypothetical protein